MRLIHTADVHLDASFAGAGMPPGLGNRRRQSLRDVFRRIMRRAAEWPADAVLLPGDLLDTERASRDTIVFLRDTFESIRPIPVFIAPGNHDPYVTGSPYATETWPANVHIFRRPEWSSVEVEGLPLTVHGFAFDGPYISMNPFGSLRVPADGRIHVAAAHGSERSRQPSGKKSYAPFDAASAAVSGLQYLALGHFHAMTPVPGFETAMYYSGAPEGHSFGEPGPHHYLEVEIDASGRVTATPVESSRMVYDVRTVHCADFTNSGQLVELLRGFAPEGEPGRLLRVLLQGEIQPTIQNALGAVRDAVADEFVFLDLVDETHPVEDYASLARSNTTMGAFIARIGQEVDDAPDAARGAVLARARQVGLAAYRGRDLPIRGMERDSA